MNSRLREGFVFPRSVSWMFIIIHPHTQADVVSFSFSICTLLFTRRAEKISFLDSVSHFQEISSFVDQKSLLILRFWLKLSKNISSFPIKFRTITPAINKVTKVLLEVYDYSTSEKVYRFKIQLVRIL